MTLKFRLRRRIETIAVAKVTVGNQSLNSSFTFSSFSMSLWEKVVRICHIFVVCSQADVILMSDSWFAQAFYCFFFSKFDFNVQIFSVSNFSLSYPTPSLLWSLQAKFDYLNALFFICAYLQGLSSVDARSRLLQVVECFPSQVCFQRHVCESVRVPSLNQNLSHIVIMRDDSIYSAAIVRNRPLNHSMINLRAHRFWILSCSRNRVSSSVHVLIIFIS